MLTDTTAPGLATPRRETAGPEAGPIVARRPASGATIAAARAPFLTVALHQAGQLGTPEASRLARAMVEGIDDLTPEAYYELSSRLERLFQRSPSAQAEARAQADRRLGQEAERRREADLAALGVGARAREGRPWL